MALPNPQPPVVILDVMNLRGTEGERKDAPFDIGQFDEFVRAVGSSLPGAVTIGIVDGTANIEGRRNNYATGDDRRELLRRTRLNPTDLQHLYLLPAPERKWLRRTDLKYLPADPVCVHLLSKFSQNAALITFDLLDKVEDIAYFPSDHVLRQSVFAPIWLSSANSWVYLARSEISHFERWDRKFFEAVEDGEIRRLEDSLTATVISGEDFAEVRNHAYGLIHDFVNEHRAAGNRTVPQVLDWQRARSPFDVLDASKFVPAPIEEEVSDFESADDVPAFSDSNVLVHTVTEQVDLIRSIDELEAYLGKRVRVTAFLRMLDGVAYLYWLGRSSRVKIEFRNAQSGVVDGLVTAEGVLERTVDGLTLIVVSGGDVTRQSVGQVVINRAKRIIRPVSYIVGKGSLDLPALPRTAKPRLPAPPTQGGVQPVSGSQIIDGDDPTTGSDPVEVTSGDPSPTAVPPQPVTPPPPPPPPPKPHRKKRVSRRLVVAVVVVASLVVAGLILRQTMFGFSIPAPQVCENLDETACDAVIKEWRGDAIRIFIYGTRDSSGVIR